MGTQEGEKRTEPLDQERVKAQGALSKSSEASSPNNDAHTMADSEESDEEALRPKTFADCIYSIHKSRAQVRIVDLGLTRCPYLLFVGLC